jgi:hypothetical protein
MDLPESHKGGVDSLHSPPLPVQQYKNGLHYLTKKDFKYHDKVKPAIYYEICLVSNVKKKIEI